MALPTLTTEEDVQTVVEYLRNKPTGEALADARKIIRKATGGRKINAYLTWGIITLENDCINLTPLGRDLLKEDKRSSTYARILRSNKNYKLALEWIQHQEQVRFTTAEVGAFWYNEQKDEFGNVKPVTLGDMVVCFFRLCQAASLGKLMMGRKGGETRLEVNKSALTNFVYGEQETSPRGEGSGEEGEPAKSITIEGLENAIQRTRGGVTINVNIQLSLPETDKKEVYENFFSALRTHLIDVKEDDKDSA